MISCSCSANPISKSLQGVVGRESEERTSTLKSWEPWISLLYNPCHVQLLIFCVCALCFPCWERTQPYACKASIRHCVQPSIDCNIIFSTKM